MLTSGCRVYVSPKMYPAFLDFVRELWLEKPRVIFLFVGGLIIFVLLVVDTFLHRKKRKERHRITRPHH